MLEDGFASEQWARTAERLFGCVDGENFAPVLLKGLDELVGFDRGVLYVVRRDAPPQILFDQAASEAVPQRETRTYLAGGYLLDPYYQAFLNGGPIGFRMDVQDPENGGERLDVRHVAFLAPVSNLACMVLVLIRDAGRVTFMPGHVDRLRSSERMVCAALRLHWRSHAAQCVMTRRDTANSGLQQRVEAALDHFGNELLTRREGQVVRLLMRGSSTKVAADQLGIAAATAALHRKRAYAKLGVRSQAQLFYRFICSLSAEVRGNESVRNNQDGWPLVASPGP